tara:strand:+ start:77 stop:691 length:615 start_codon:yes stop_codon:yes gene_type:complete
MRGWLLGALCWIGCGLTLDLEPPEEKAQDAAVVDGDDGGVETEDGGVRSEDGGVGNEDGGVASEDGGVVSEDGGAHDAGTRDAGQDAGPEDLGVDMGCIPVEETCNGLDDDCDGVADNDFDLNADPMNCGGCGTVCPTVPNGRPECAMGACQVECAEGWADCDSDLANGCETSLSLPTSCGSCGSRCGVGQVCLGGLCAVEMES